MRKLDKHEKGDKSSGILIADDAPLVPRFESKMPQDETYYLYGGLQEPIEYVDLIQALRNSEEGQQIKIHINGPGGYLTTCLAIINAIKSAEAEVVTILDGEACSAHALLWLAGHSKHIASQHTYLMIHQAGWGFHGKQAEHENETKIIKKITVPLVEEFASWILTPEELDDMNKGVDIYIHGSEIVQRAEEYSAKMRATQEAAEAAENAKEKATPKRRAKAG